MEFSHQDSTKHADFAQCELCYTIPVCSFFPFLLNSNKVNTDCSVNTYCRGAYDSEYITSWTEFIRVEAPLHLATSVIIKMVPLFKKLRRGEVFDPNEHI